MADFINNILLEINIKFLNSLCDILDYESRNENRSNVTRATYNGHVLCFVCLKHF